jgi:hypothetical protein
MKYAPEASGSFADQLYAAITPPPLPPHLTPGSMNGQSHRTACEHYADHLGCSLDELPFVLWRASRPDLLVALAEFGTSPGVLERFIAKEIEGALRLR